MLTLILSILSSTGFGSAIGWIGGLLNRTVDLKVKQLDYKFELDKRDKDIEQTRAEVAGQIAVADRAIDEAKVVAAGMVESEAYKAMAESYKSQNEPLSEKFEWVSATSKLIRPLITIIFTIFSLVISVYIIVKAMNAGVAFDKADWKEWLTFVIQWVFFQAGVVIGWWFANRPSGRTGGN